MAQVTTGIRGILSRSKVYECFRDILGGQRATRLFVSEFIRPVPGMRILDIGCGPAGLLDFLPRDVQYHGVDINEKYVTSGRQKYGHRATFQCCAMEDAAAEAFRDYDLVLGMGFLHHLDQKPAERFFALAAQALRPGGRCLTVDSCLVPGQHPVARLLIAMDRGRNPRTAGDSVALARTAFAEVAHTVRHALLRRPYTHIIMECQQHGRQER
jgi:2-polyprenyl-3-methyl-5-hydroxy-6-metoxy-1,4-benzoquinol methylase